MHLKTFYSVLPNHCFHSILAIQEGEKPSNLYNIMSFFNQFSDLTTPSCKVYIDKNINWKIQSHILSEKKRAHNNALITYTVHNRTWKTSFYCATLNGWLQSLCNISVEMLQRSLKIKLVNNPISSNSYVKTKPQTSFCLNTPEPLT